MMILSVFSCVSSVDSWFCIQEMFSTKLALVLVSRVTHLPNPKERQFVL